MITPGCFLAGACLHLVPVHGGGGAEARVPPPVAGGSLVPEAAARVWPAATAPEPQMSEPCRRVEAPDATATPAGAAPPSRRSAEISMNPVRNRGLYEKYQINILHLPP